ncbi:MAG: dihydropteroate synthase [Candidatus Omnitrophota bacterium]
MFIIGESINGMYKNIAGAIKKKDKAAIQGCALSQIKAGADALDINCGPASNLPQDDMRWLLESVQEVTDKPLSIDSSNPKIIASCLKLMKNPAIINSTTADAEKLSILVPLAKEYRCRLIGLTISEKGIPQNKEQRMESAVSIVSCCLEEGFPVEDLYLDPVVMPVNVAQAQMRGILEAIEEFKVISEPSPKCVVGLSNVSQGTCSRSLINRAFLTMAVAYGLDAAILDPCDSVLMDSLITAELVLNKQIYCDSYLEAYKRKNYGS